MKLDSLPTSNGPTNDLWITQV